MWADPAVASVFTVQTLAVLWLGAFAGGFASGAAGFAFGIVGSAIWLHALDAFLNVTQTPVLKFAEGVIVVALALHMTLGLRVLAVEFLPVREHTSLTVSVCLAAALAVGLLFMLNVG